MEVDCGCGWWVVVQLNSVSLFLFKRVALSVPPAISHSLFRSLALPPELFRPQSSMKIHSTPRGDWLDLELGDVYVCVCAGNTCHDSLSQEFSGSALKLLLNRVRK